VRAVVNCRVCDLATVLYLIEVTICNCSINPLTNPNPVYSHSRTRIIVIMGGVWIANWIYSTLTDPSLQAIITVSLIHTRYSSLLHTSQPVVSSPVFAW
jgi:hypothetical protein